MLYLALPLRLEETSLTNTFIFKRWEHHSQHSGYDRLADYLGTRMPVIDYQNRGKRIIPWQVVNYFVGNRAGLTNYMHEAFYTELSAAIALTKRRHSIFHFLYGDFDFRYTGFLNGLRGNHIVASFHLPPAQAKKLFHVTKHFNRLSAIFVVGKNQIPYFAQYADPKKIHWLPHGVDTNYFVPAPKRSCSKKKRILFVGRHMRDINTLIQVIHLFRESTRQVDFSIVAGKDPEWHSVSQFDNVEFLSGIPEEHLLSLYQSTDLLLLPLIDATANNSLLEALSCGLPAVVTNMEGIRDYSDSTCSMFCPPKDAQAMYTAACELLENENRREELSAASRNKALEFSWEITVEKLRGIYASLSPVD